MDQPVAQSETASGLDFYIPARESLQERRPATLKHGETFAVFDNHGDLLAWQGNPEGLYYRDTRHLSHYELRLNGARPLLLTSTMQDDNGALVVDLTNPDFYQDGKVALPKDTLHLHRMRFVHDAAACERLSIFNYGAVACPVRLSFVFDADFIDLFEARGQTRGRRGERAVELGDARVLFRYVGLDGTSRDTEIAFSPAPTRIMPSAAVYAFEVPARERVTLFVRVACSHGPVRRPAWDGRRFLAELNKARRTLRQSSSRAASIESSSSLVNDVARRSVADLYMLMTDTEWGPYPCAGIPWFSTPFGRDGIITALFMLWLDPEIARGTLLFLAATQAGEVDRRRDAEPGKILHETRAGEMAALGEVPFGLYYGSVDATPLFVVLAGEYWQRTGDAETIRKIWPNIEAALDWIETYGDVDGDGFVDYARQSENGLVNQGWKDSNDSVFHADGSEARGPVALVEVQAYVYAAWRHGARLARVLGREAMAEALWDKAETLREAFEDAFWCEDLGIYALALDGDKKPCRLITSNAGHVLFAGICTPERARRTARTLLTPGSFSGWGVRTLAAGQARYNPMSYHNGSVWPHDNAMIALGLARYQLKEPVVRLFAGLADAAGYMDIARLPELFCGFRRRPRKAPTAYPVACAPQAWAAAAPLALLQACLGLSVDQPRGELRLENPVLPESMDWLRIRRLTVGKAHARLEFRREAEGVALSVPERAGEISVIAVH